VLGAAFCQHNDTDGRQQYQGQDHVSKVAGGERKSTMAAAAPLTPAETPPEEEWDGFGYADPAAFRADVGSGSPNGTLAQGLQYVLIAGSAFGRRPRPMRGGER
jgi:hypothetical protein